MPFILPIQDQGRFQPLQLVQITCWNSSFLSSSISNLKITWVCSSSRYWRDWMLWWWLTHNKQSTMSEISGTDHCQEEDIGLGTGTVREVMMFFKEQKEVAVANFWGFFFSSLSVSDLYYFIGISFESVGISLPIVSWFSNPKSELFSGPLLNFQ